MCAAKRLMSSGVSTVGLSPLISSALSAASLMASYVAYDPFDLAWDLVSAIAVLADLEAMASSALFIMSVTLCVLSPRGTLASV
jgi:hypothetical protein